MLISLSVAFQTGRIPAATAPDAALLTPRGRPGLAPAPTTAGNGRETGSLSSGNETGRSCGLSSRSSSSLLCSSNSRYNSRETGSPNPETGLAGDGSPS